MSRDFDDPDGFKMTPEEQRPEAAPLEERPRIRFDPGTLVQLVRACKTKKEKLLKKYLKKNGVGAGDEMNKLVLTAAVRTPFFNFHRFPPLSDKMAVSDKHWVASYANRAVFEKVEFATVKVNSPGLFGTAVNCQSGGLNVPLGNKTGKPRRFGGAVLPAFSGPKKYSAGCKN